MKKLTRILMLAYSIMLLSPIAVLAQVDQTFWFVVPETTREHLKEPGVLRITAFEEQAEVRISQPANPDFDPIILNIPANTQVKHEFWDRTGIPYNTMLWAIENGTMDAIGSHPRDWPNVSGNDPVASGPGEIPVFKKGLLIESTNGADISVYYEVANKNNPERFNLKGQNALGREFLIPSQSVFENYSETPKAREKADIVATENGTVVTFNFDPDKHNFVGKPSSGNSFSVTLNRGESFSLRSNSRQASQSLGGIFIESSKPIAVTISDDSIKEPEGPIHYDLVGDQLIPISIAGTRYIAMHPSFGTSFFDRYGKYSGTGAVSNQVFIWPVGDPTGIKINDQPVSNPDNGSATFSRGDHYVTNILDNGIYIESEEPVIVYQISSYGYELGGGVLPALDCTGSKSVTFARVYTGNFFIQILTKKKNIWDENGNLNFEAFYQGGASATNAVFEVTSGTSVGWKPVPNSGEGDEQWFSFVKYTSSLTVGTPITVKFKDAAKVDLDELFHLSVLDANGSSMSYGYFSSYNSISIAGPKAICKEGDIIELRTNGVLVNWFSSADPITPFALNTDIVEVEEPGEYWVESPNPTCESSDRTSIDYVIPRFELGDDGSACPGDTIVLGLDEPFDFAAEYIWTVTVNGTVRDDLEGEHQISFVADESTTYNVKLEVITAVEGLETCNYSQEVTIEVGVNPNPDVLLNANEEVCEGSALSTQYFDGHNYEWSFGGAVISDATYIIPEDEGTYTLRVYTENGCELIQDINVSINPLPTVTLANQMTCEGQPATFSIDPTLYPGGSFKWHTGETTSSITLTEPEEDVWVEVTDAKGCTTKAEASFGWYNETVFPSDTILVCYSHELTVPISDQFTGYQWSYKADPMLPGAPGSLTPPNQEANDHILTVRAGDGTTDDWSGRYYVTATDENGCPVDTYFDLIITPIPELTLIDPQISLSDPRMCQGDTITITYVDEYNREFTNFRWSYRANTAAPYTVVKDGPQSWIEAFEAGEYELYASMENGCDAVGSIEVTTVEAPIFEMGDQKACPDQEIVLGIKPNSYISYYQDETTPDRYEWITGIRDMEITGQVDTLSTDPTYTVDEANRGAYRLTAYNGFGCFAARWADASSHPDVDFSLDDETICDNDSYTLELPAGVTASAYTWYEVIPGMDIEISIDLPPTISGKEAGTYRYKLVATSNDGCIGEAEMNLTVLAAPDFTLEDGAVCPGESISIEAQDSYASYTWNGVEGTNTYEVTTGGDVTLIVADNNGCSATATATITIGSLPNVTLNDITMCPDENHTLSVPYSSEDGYTILWELPSGRSIRNQSTIDVVRGDYKVTVFDALGCNASDDATVTWKDFPWVYFGPNMVDICQVNLPVKIEAQGDYENWSDMIWHDDLYENERQRIASLSDTVNVIRVRNFENCWSTASQSVLLALPTIYESGADTIGCEPTDGTPFSAELDGGEFVLFYDSSSDEAQEKPIESYRWYRGDTDKNLSNDQIYTAIDGGEYIVEIFDGCWMHTDTFNITLYPNPTISAIDTTIYRQVTVFAENGTEPYSYAINSGAPQDDKTFKNLPNGDYTVYVIDRNGCEDSMAFLFESSYNIEVPNFFTPNNDGFNDRWEIKGLEKLPESIIYIYDRYGKLLRKYSSTDPAWDGEYLNRPIAADDYWYVIHLLPIDKYLRGNFTLKR